MGAKPRKPVDMGIYPHEASETYVPPPDARERTWVEYLTDDVLLCHRIRRFRDCIVSFSIEQQQAERRPVARVDTSHGTVHKHQFFAGSDREDRHEIAPIPATRGESFVNTEYPRQAESMAKTAIDNLRRWRNG